VFGDTYAIIGDAEKELKGASGLTGVTLTKPEHDCPTQFIRVGVGVALVWDPAIFTGAVGGVGVGVTAKLTGAGVLSPAM